MVLAFDPRRSDVQSPGSDPFGSGIRVDRRSGGRDEPGAVATRQSCLLVVDVPPSAGLSPTDLVADATTSTWRFHVLVTARKRLNWPASVAAADPMSGWVLAADIAPADEFADGRSRAETLERWLSLFNARGFRASGDVSGGSTRGALEEILDYRYFDRVLIGNGDCVRRSRLRGSAETRLARRLRRDYGLDAATTALLPAR